MSKLCVDVILPNSFIKSHVLKFDPTENHYVFQLEPRTVAPTPPLRRRADELVELLTRHVDHPDVMLSCSLTSNLTTPDKVPKISGA